MEAEPATTQTIDLTSGLAHRWNKAEQPPKASALDGFAHVPPQNETALAQAVSQHPVAVAVCCGDNIDNWHQYTGGIFEIPNTGTVLRRDTFCLPCGPHMLETSIIARKYGCSPS